LSDTDYGSTIAEAEAKIKNLEGSYFDGCE
jgi:hypothetical protein